MKTVYFVFYISILFLAGCSNEVQPSTPSIGNLKMDVNVEDVSYPDQVKVYEANYIELDVNDVTDLLIKNEIIDDEIYAMGHQFQTDTESLIIYDGGEAMGMQSGVNGGFLYIHRPTNDMIDYYTIASIHAGPPLLDAQLDKYNQNEDFATFQDLDFKPYKEAEKEIDSVLSSIGIEGIQTELVYALDTETMKQHDALYRKVDTEADLKDVNWNSNQEAYLFISRQQIDNIPLINFIWQEKTRDVEEATETEVYAIYNSNGIHQLSVTNYFSIVDSQAPVDILNLSEALDIAEKYYSSIILSKGTVIDKAELFYIAIEQNHSYKLTPAWVFQLVKEAETPDTPNSKPEKYVDYSYFVIDAITGDILTQTGESQ